MTSAVWQADAVETALGFCRRDLGVGELGFQVRAALAAGGGLQVVGGLEVLQRAIGVRGLLLQFDQAVLQPLARDPGRGEFGAHRRRDIALGDSVGDFGGLGLVFGFERHVDDVGNVFASNGQALGDRFDRGAFECSFGIIHRRTRMPNRPAMAFLISPI